MKVAPKTILLSTVFSIFLSIVEDNGVEECESLFENRIVILIECYQNDLEVTCISSLIKYFDNNCQNTFWSMLISLVSRSILKNRSYVSKFERYWKLQRSYISGSLDHVEYD